MRILSFTLLILVSLVCFAQQFAVELSAMNLLYKGIENPANISASGVSKENLVVETSPNLKLTDSGTLRVISGREGFVKVGKLKRRIHFGLESKHLE